MKVKPTLKSNQNVWQYTAYFIHFSLIKIMVGLFFLTLLKKAFYLHFWTMKNLKTISSYKAQLDPRVSQLFKQLREKLVLLEIVVL